MDASNTEFIVTHHVNWNATNRADRFTYQIEWFGSNVRPVTEWQDFDSEVICFIPSLGNVPMTTSAIQEHINECESCDWLAFFHYGMKLEDVLTEINNAHASHDEQYIRAAKHSLSCESCQENIIMSGDWSDKNVLTIAHACIAGSHVPSFCNEHGVFVDECVRGD